MALGRVKWFNDEKGWGFIKQDAGPDVFVHYSQIQGEGRRRLYEDEVVEFDIKEGPKGLQAVNVLRRTHPIDAWLFFILRRSGKKGDRRVGTRGKGKATSVVVARGAPRP